MDFVWITFMVGITVLLSFPLGKAMAVVMQPPQNIGLSPNCLSFHHRLENIIGKIGGKVSDERQNWKQYCISMLIFNSSMFLVVFAILWFQQYLPLNPDRKGALSWDLIFHTTVSFVANTNLQHYSGEISMSYFSQIFVLMWLQFVSAATGIAALAALARGLSGSNTGVGNEDTGADAGILKTDMGNFYRDLLRATFLILVPLAVIVAIILVLIGVPMTLQGSVVATTLEGAVQTIARGPVAAFVAIKQLGTNGGGFFGVNSAHPFENPNFFTNIIECMGIMLIPMASVWMFGHITKRMRHASVIFAVMGILLIVKLSSAVHFESAPAPVFADMPIVQNVGNMEGKELRFGSTASALWAVFTTATSNGSVNCMHDSLNPLTGLVALIGMWLNSTFGGVGVGFINIFLYIVVGVFISGMMVGRTPEYFAKKLETGEMKLALLGLLVHPMLILGSTALFASTSYGLETVLNTGSHGFTEILYEFTSAAANNGSGFEGLGDNTVAWNVSTAIVMLLGRFIPIIIPISIAGSLSVKKSVPETIGTLHTDTILFGSVLLGAIILIGALLFLPVAVLGPVSEHLSSLSVR